MSSEHDIKIRCTRNEQLGIIRQVQATVGESFPCLIKYCLEIATRGGDSYPEEDCPFKLTMNYDCERCLKQCIEWEITD